MELLATDFPKILKYKFHENQPRWSGVAPCGQTDRHGKVIVFFAIFRSVNILQDFIGPSGCPIFYVL
jgi:hypothetical protein